MKNKMFSGFWVLLLVFLLEFAGVAHADVIFEDNFDSHADWQPRPGTNDVGTAGATASCGQGDCTGQVPTGWSYFRTTGWWWGPTYQDTIRVTGDNYKGGSGKAYTQWNESNNGASGDGWGADGILAKTFPQDYKELYVRFWMKMKSGFQWSASTDGMLKILRIFHYDRTGDIFQFFSSGNSAPLSGFLIKETLNWGWRYHNDMRCDPQESSYYCPDGASLDGLFLNSGSEPGDEGQSADGQWHRYDIHVKMNTYSGDWQSDGVWRFWYDGILKESVLNKKWIVSGNDSEHGWNTVSIGGNAFNTYSDASTHSEQWYTIDDIVISTTAIPYDYVIGGGSVGVSNYKTGAGSVTNKSGAGSVTFK